MKRSKQWFRGKTALVTGAASGIGRATALLLADRGAHMILCDRDGEGLRSVERDCARRSEVVLAEKLDVAVRADYAEFASRVHSKVDAVDVLVNNAGVGLSGGILDTTLDDFDWVLSINLGGVIHGCHYFCPKMVTARRGGHVVNVSSVLGFFATRDTMGYSAAKFGVFGLSESLRAELAPHGVGVSTVCPGVIDTPIVKVGRVRAPGDVEKLRERTVAGFARFGHPPEVVARSVERAILSNRAVMPASPDARAFWFAKRWLPDGVVRAASWLTTRALQGSS